MDEFSVKVVITSPWGNETWEWLGDVSTNNAEQIHTLLGKPDFVQLKPVAAGHGTFEGSLSEKAGVHLE